MEISSQSQQSSIQETHESCGVDEATPLLHMPLSELDIAISKHDTSESYVYAAKREIKWIASSSSLTILTLLLEFSFYTANVLAVGHLGAKELGAMTLAVTCQVIIGMAPTFGLLSAMDTFCSTAYTASRDKTLVGFHFQRGIIAVCTHFILVAPILWNAEKLLLLISLDPEIAHLSGLYLRIHILSTLPFELFEATKRYLQAQGIMRAGAIVTLIIAPIHWINSYVFVRSSSFGMGFVGAPIVNALSNWSLLVGILLYACNSRATETWGGWKLSAFRNMWAYYRLAVPSVITLCAEWVSFELLALGASYFGAYQLAGQAIMFNTVALLYQLSNGLGHGTSPRIGNLIGAAKPRQARITADVSILVSALFGIMGILFLSFCGDWWISVYTNDPYVARETAKLVPVVCIFVMSDGLNGVLSAILRGLGRQKASANIFFDESTALLRTSSSELDIAISKHDTSESYVYAAKREIKWIASSSSLTTLTLFLEFSFYTVNVLSIGHLGAKELGAISLALTCQMIIAMAPTFGLLSAMDTFCSTAYTASRDKTLVGFHFQRGIISVCTLFVIAAPILWNSKNILLLVMQDADIAHLSGLYLRIHILSMLPFALFEATKRYLQAQGIMRAGTIVTMIVAPIHWINSYVFVRSSRFGIGFVGAPIINVFSNCLLLIGILLYARNSRATETWGGWKLSAFHNMWAYYRLAIPSVITICAYWICIELLALGVSSFGANQLAGHAIMLNSIACIYQMSNGFGYSTSPRIGNLIGAAKPRQARIAADMSVLASTLIGVAGTLFISLCGGWWTQLYTDDPNVARETARLIPVACLLIVSDGLEAVLSAILRGIGRQKANAKILVLGYYVCGVPAAIYLGYIKHMETPGLWWGLCTGMVVVSSLQIIYIYLWIDWKDEVRLCLLRLKDNSASDTVDIAI
ncbi:hypothetical protein IW140_001434 [Coemansia sp. RSA 1813]|nr:hypothetical protein EV179_001882 [Coemansia sp. RSA 487]KAJ2571793.1 hypothetical protein IW140_001434 [Coemansia sp. RSA 1813]